MALATRNPGLTLKKHVYLRGSFPSETGHMLPEPSSSFATLGGFSKWPRIGRLEN